MVCVHIQSLHTLANVYVHGVHKHSIMSVRAQRAAATAAAAAVVA